MAPDELFEMGATELGRRIHAGELTSVEVTERALHLLDTRGRELNAVAELTRDLAMSQAKAADAEIKSGKIRGPLHGVPFGAKDLLATKNIPTRWGSPAHKDQVFDFDATVISRLREAGAVLVAKLGMVELAGGGGYEYAYASLHGPGKCPFDVTKWSGGSSSGSGSAVGAGLVPFAIGTETWGSIMCPSAFCNVTGLRPTYGRVPRHGAMALCFSMDKIGPMARSAEDCGHILQAIAGFTPLDPSSENPAWKYRSGRPGKKLRIGLLPTDYKKNEAPDAEKLFAAAMDVLRKQGHTITEMKLPDFPYDQAASAIVGIEGASAFENLIRSPKIELLADKTQVAGFLASLSLPGVDYLRALKVRTLAGQATAEVWKKFDVLAAPTLLQGAPDITKSLNDTFGKMGGNGGPGNLLGWPSISVPMGMTSTGLPLGLEFTGAPYNEQTILSLAAAYQSKTEFHRAIPGRNLTS
ncbi:MAG: amidase [Chthonomonadales bacterium]